MSRRHIFSPQSLSRCGPSLTETMSHHRGRLEGWELRRVLGGTSVPRIGSAANTFFPQGRCGRVEEQPAVITATQTAPGSPSLHPPSSPTSGREGSKRRTWLCPRAEPHHSKTEPHKPYMLCQTPKYPSPSTLLLLLFHFIFRSLAPVSSFLFVFGSYYSWLPSVFCFPSSALIRMFILPACFSAFPRCLLVVAGQRSVFGLGKGSHAAGLGPDHPLETPACSRRGEWTLCLL